MILLHHRESELSRNLLATMPAGTTVVDCTNGIPADYTGPRLVGAFPSVVVDVPAYSETVEDWDAEWEFKGMRTQTVLAGQRVLRMPVNWDAVAQFNAYAEKRAAQSPAVG